MSCKKTVKLLSSYLDNAVSDKEKTIIEKHIGKCADCNAFYNDIVKTRDILRALPHSYPEKDFTSKIMGKIKANDIPLNNFELFFYTARNSFIAAAGIFCIIAAFSFFTPKPDIKFDNFDNIEAMNKYVLSDTFVNKNINDYILG